ncbi:PRTRC system protein B [Deinococcus soli (ex Cha et al. 2016)]|uniref:PRTRC system protein B n=1 Tax=Deinococcus soli (ex Cha et al. 2016) TaxID=1309411 RepID=UPI0016658E34|nr:PRTRC system protein B [Deinococcus soli (ex Cha et al. 2016)]GGB70866.1 hypothetical protein GCM10008019_28800 [Deinococcus soli (ex Cha et al. 2016)]
MHLAHPYKDPDPLELKQALLVYANSQRGVIMRADVNVTNGHVELNNAHEVTDDLISTLMRMVDRRPLTLVGDHVVALSHDACAWFVPARTRTLFFSPDRDKAVAELSGRSFPQPPLLFISRGRGLSVYALQHNEKPTASTPLYRAPYYNVFDTDSVCTGAVTIPGGGDPAHTEAWELAFFESNFTHVSGNQKRWQSGGTHKELWEEAERRGEFDPAWLVPAGKTLEQAVCGRQ